MGGKYLLEHGRLFEILRYIVLKTSFSLIFRVIRVNVSGISIFWTYWTSGSLKRIDYPKQLSGPPSFF